jgi:hypothetical protein
MGRRIHVMTMAAQLAMYINQLPDTHESDVPSLHGHPFFLRRQQNVYRLDQT